MRGFMLMILFQGFMVAIMVAIFHQSKGKRTAKGGYSKTALFLNFVPQNEVYTLSHALKSIMLRLNSLYNRYFEIYCAIGLLGHKLYT